MFSDHFLQGKSPTECFTYEAFYHDTISNPILQMGKSSLRYVRNAQGHLASAPRAHTAHCALQNLVLSWLSQHLLGNLLYLLGDLGQVSLPDQTSVCLSVTRSD